MKRTTFAVEITISGRPEISRFFTTLAAARKWARFCSAKFGPTRILAGGAGGMEVR